MRNLEAIETYETAQETISEVAVAQPARVSLEMPAGKLQELLTALAHTIDVAEFKASTTMPIRICGIATPKNAAALLTIPHACWTNRTVTGGSTVVLELKRLTQVLGRAEGGQATLSWTDGNKSVLVTLDGGKQYLLRESRVETAWADEIRKPQENLMAFSAPQGWLRTLIEDVRMVDEEVTIWSRKRALEVWAVEAGGATAYIRFPSHSLTLYVCNSPTRATFPVACLREWARFGRISQSVRLRLSTKHVLMVEHVIPGGATATLWLAAHAPKSA